MNRYKEKILEITFSMQFNNKIFQIKIIQVLGHALIIAKKVKIIAVLKYLDKIKNN